MTAVLADTVLIAVLCMWCLLDTFLETNALQKGQSGRDGRHRDTLLR